MRRILVVDDEPAVLAAFQELLIDLGHQVAVTGRGDEALECLQTYKPDVVVTDLCLPGWTGLDAIHQIRAICPKTPVIIMTGYGTMGTAIEATKLGAFDYQLKPFEPESMVAAIERALETVRLMQRGVQLNPDSTLDPTDAIIGDSVEMQELFKSIGRVAPTDATVLIRGESGVGKELVARALYQHSLRATSPLLVVNCATIPESLLESELFGHERGAFTGAQARRIGKFEQAARGTVFLDEIGDVPLNLQAKLLRILQQRTFERLGGNDVIQANVRILAATNRDLEQAIAAGTFREDLFHRLNVVTIHVPPLRRRAGDIPKLVDYFLQRYARELQTEKPLVSEEAMEALQSYEWPGNVRELEHCIYRTMIFTHGYPIQEADIQRARGSAQKPGPSPASRIDQSHLLDIVQDYLDGHFGAGTHAWLLAEIDRLLVQDALRRTAGNQTRAAQLLGLTRPTLHAKIQRYRLESSG
jgi:nitrogen regulation protein NR(I)